MKNKLDDYDGFVEKFKPRKTTDDCYTPPAVYEVVKGYVSDRYGIDPASMVRPFYPGGDYESFDYPAGCVVVDNPPFSILAKIKRFYMKNDVKFFLFAPAMTLLSSYLPKTTCIAAGVSVIYENGAHVRTSFVTNLEPGIALRSSPSLYSAIEFVQKIGEIDKRKPVYDYPAHIITASRVNQLSKCAVDFRVPETEMVKVSCLDSQKIDGKGIFGGGFLVSNQIAGSYTRAFKHARAFKREREGQAILWTLSDREHGVIEGLSTSKGF